MSKSNGVLKMGHMVNYYPTIFILGPNVELVVQLGELPTTRYRNLHGT